MRLPVLPVVLVAIAAASCAAPASSEEDARLLTFAREPFNKENFRNPHQTWGVHKGTPVVVDYICSDVCPQYTVRVIHYEMKPNQSCTAIGGIEKAMRVPMGIGTAERTYCFPQVLVENWSDYQK